MVVGLAVVLFCQLVGEIFAYLTHLPLPAPVVEDAPAPKPAASRGRRPHKPKAAPAAEPAAGADKS